MEKVYHMWFEKISNAIEHRSIANIRSTSIANIRSTSVTQIGVWIETFMEPMELSCYQVESRRTLIVHFNENTDIGSMKKNHR